MVLVGVAAIWGSSFIAIRWALDDIPPFLLAAVRFFLAAVPMVFFVRRPAVAWTVVVGYGLAIGAGQFGFLFLALKLGFPTGLASLLIQVQVFFTIALAAAFAKDRPRAHHLVGACIAALGIVALAAERVSSGAAGSLLGLALVLGSAASWATGNIVAKVAGQRQPFDTFSLAVWSSLVAPLPLAALSWVTEGPAAWGQLVHASARAWACVLFMAYVATLVGYGAWNRMLHRHPAAVVAPFALLIPVVGLASAALILGEEFTAIEAVAALLVLMGLAVAVLGGRMASRPRGPLTGKTEIG
jgi:O-acetylserine/cysteine efflux transporter